MTGIARAQSPNVEATTKICAKCRIEKPREAFGSTPNKRGADKPRYLVSRCKACQEIDRRARGVRPAADVFAKRAVDAEAGRDARFWSKVDKSVPGGCWVWIGAKHAQFGYGIFRDGGRAVTAHRFSWLLANGDAGEMCVLHKCDNPPCCNPDHLFLGTRTDNANDKVSKRRQSRLVGEDSPRAILTEATVLELRRQRAAGVSYSALGERYGVNKQTARHAVLGKNWGHVKGGPPKDR